MERKIRKSVLKYLPLTLLSIFLPALIKLIATVILARIYTPAEFSKPNYPLIYSLNKDINKYYNNRRGDIAVGVSHVGNAFDYQPAIDAAEVYYLESLAFYCFAKDYQSGELERSTVTSDLKGAKGWQYIANSYNQLAVIAWFNYRKGGTLKDASVTFGVGADNDPTKPKTLPKLMSAFCQIRSREVTFYCYNDTGNTYPIRPDVPDIYNGYQDVGFALASIMFPVSQYPVEGAKIKASAYAFPPPLPSVITPGKTRPVDGNGSYSVHQGPGGTFVSCMFGATWIEYQSFKHCLNAIKKPDRVYQAFLFVLLI